MEYWWCCKPGCWGARAGGGRELTAQIAPLVERSRKLERYYSERRAADRVSLSVASQRYPFCAKAFVEFLHLLDEPHIQVSFKEMEMAAVIDEVTARRSAFGIIFVSDMTEHFIGRILREKNLTFQPLVDIRPRVFLRKGHPLSGERAVRLEQLYAYPYAVFTQSDSNYHFAEEAVVGTGAEFDRVVSVSDRATAYNVMAHTDCVSTGSGVLPDGYGDDRLMTLPLIGGVPDMLRDGESGLLVGCDPDEVCAACERLIDSEDLRRTLGQNALADSARFSAETMAKRYCEEYERLTAKK